MLSRLKDGFLRLHVLQVILLGMAISAIPISLFYLYLPKFSTDIREYPIQLVEQEYFGVGGVQANYGAKFLNDSSFVALRVANTPDELAIGSIDMFNSIEFNIHHEPRTEVDRGPANNTLDVDGDNLDELLIDLKFSTQIAVGISPITDADSVHYVYYGSDERREILDRSIKPDSIYGMWLIEHDIIRSSSMLPLETESLFFILEHGRGEIYRYNALCIYVKGDPPALIQKLERIPPVNRGLVTRDSHDTPVLIFVTQAPAQGNVFHPPRVPMASEVSTDSLFDRRGGAFALDQNGDVLWTSAFGRGGGDGFVFSARAADSSSCLVVYNQNCFLEEGASPGCLLYWLDVSTGAILDSAKYDGYFSPFIGPAASGELPIGLIVGFDGEVQIIDSNGLFLATYTDKLATSTNSFVPIMKTDKDELVFATVGENNYVILRNLKSRIVGIHPGYGRLRVAPYKYGNYSEERLVIDDDVTMSELKVITHNFPLWWIWKMRWYVISIIVPTLVLLIFYYLLHYRAVRKREMDSLKKQVMERTQELENAYQKLKTTSNHLISIYNSTSDGIITIDYNMKILSMNESFKNMFSRYNMRDLEFLNKILDGGFASITPLIEKVIKESNEYENYYLKMDTGRIMKISLKPFKISNNGSNQALLTIRDVSRLFSMEKGSSENKYPEIIGRSEPIASLFHVMDDLKSSLSTVLILGESGTGKELVARAIHQSSKRSEQAFVAVNCASIDKNLQKSELFGYVKGAFTGAISNHSGHFGKADGGTLFLDELGDLALDVQSLLLRVLESGEYQRIGEDSVRTSSARIIAATNKLPLSLIKSGLFREELYYRLNVVQIQIPPLRERKSDIPLLVNHFIELFSNQMGKAIPSVSEEAMQLLRRYSWPGNVRELKNVLEHAVLFCREDTIQAHHIREDVRIDSLHSATKNSEEIRNLSSKLEDRSTDDWDREYLLHVLELVHWNKRKAAKLLQVSPPTLYSHLKKHSIM